jgi:O-antigen/teichoic acid export membrane protein
MLISSTTKAIANNTAFQVIGKIVSMSVTILATIIITRMYSREGFGEFSLMQNIPALFFIVADFGFNAIATRELSKDFSKAEKYLGNILLMRVFMSVCLMIFAGLAISFFPYSEGLKYGIYLALFLILTQSLYSTTNIIFQVKLRYDYSTIGYILGSFVILGLVLLFSYLRISIVWVNFSYVIGGLVTFFVNLYLIRRYINLNIKLNFDPHLWKFMFIQSMPLGLMFIFSQINFRADSLMLSVLKVPEFVDLNPTEAVAIYGLPYKIFEVALVVPTFFMNAAYPVYVRHMEEGRERIKETFTKSAAVLLGVGVVAAILGVIFAPLAIYILGGSEFSQSVQVLRLLVIGLPIFYVSQPFSWLLVTMGNQRFLPLIYLSSAVFNLSANYYFIPIYSFYASSVLTWISELIILTLLIVFVYKSWKRKYA